MWECNLHPDILFRLECCQEVRSENELLLLLAPKALQLLKKWNRKQFTQQNYNPATFFLVLFHWLDSWKQGGGGKKKTIKAELQIPTATVVRSQKKCTSGGRMGKSRMKWNIKQPINSPAIWSPPRCPDTQPFPNSVWMSRHAIAWDYLKSERNNFFFKHIYIPRCIPPVRLNKRASKGKEWPKMGIPVCFLCVIHKLRPKESITSPQ